MALIKVRIFMNKFWQKIKTLFNRHYSFIFAYIPYLQCKEIETCQDNIQTLVLGSSHGYYGFDAKEPEFNLCAPSQDLYYSFMLYKKYAYFKNLKNVVLFYSVFSPGFELEKTSEKERCAYYKAFFQIPYKSMDDKTFALELKNAKKYINKKLKNFTKKKHLDITQNRGNPVCWPEISYVDLDKRVNSHLKHNQRNSDQNLFLRKLINLTKQNNHKLYIVIAPVSSQMRNLLPDYNLLFSSLIHIVKENPNVKLLNYWSSVKFCDSDLSDFDHLNKTGCNKLSQLIRDEVNAEK